MVLFSIDGLGFSEAKKYIQENTEILDKQFYEGNMKAGRFLGLFYLMEAAERGDITSQIAIGYLYEFGVIVERNITEAKEWYAKAIAQDHPNKDGMMIAAAASEAMKRLER